MSSVLTSTIAKGSVWNRIKSIPATYPFGFGVIFSGIKTSCSDLLVQKVIEQRESIDWYRNSAFATFGFLYLGGVQYMIYVPIFNKLFPYTKTFLNITPWYHKLRDIRGLSQSLMQVCIDQCLHHPLMYFPAFYITKEYIMKKDPSLTRCLQEYRTNVKEDLLALWKIWVPCTIVNFTFMPYHLRIPFTAGVSLIWTCILSVMRGGDLSNASEMVGGEVTGTTLHILEETFDTLLYHEPKELESNKLHIVLTASGRDQAGWVTSLASCISNAGGNITQSKMVRLGHEFIIVMHIAVLPEQQKDLLKSIQNETKLRPLNIRTVPITRRQTGTYHTPTIGIHLRCQGPDRPGMLASISKALTDANLNIENVHTELVRSHHHQGGTDFVVTADAVAVHHMSYDDTQRMVQELETLKKQLNLDMVDIRIQRYVTSDNDIDE